MVSAANPQANGNPAWGSPPPSNPGTWANHPWSGPPFWHPVGLSRPLGIAAMILGFALWWPIGLALLFLMKWSGHMGCWGRRGRAMYDNTGYQNAGWQGGGGPAAHFQGWAPWKAWGGQPQTAQPQGVQQQVGQPSGNRAFDEYRADTLRRLEDEQREFGSFLDRLRFAKDKAEFDQFMTERRERPPSPPASQDQPQP
jgi:hypothetical protein